MLVLTRNKNQWLTVGPGVKITVVDIRGDKVRLGIDAPHDVKIERGELNHEGTKDTKDHLEVPESEIPY